MLANRAPLLRLNNGKQIPAFGLGACAPNSGSDEVIQAVKDAIDIGYRHFDCDYENAGDIGQAIGEKIEEGKIKCEDVYLVSKLPNTFHRPDLVEEGCRQSLRKLGVEYMDLFIVHFPTRAFADVDICDTWRAMERLVKKGLVKSIGVLNSSCEQLTKILKKCTITPAVNQIEMHPYFCNRKLAEFCMARGIRVISSPLQNPEKMTPNEPDRLQDPVLLEIAQRYRKTVAQVILRWVFQRGIVVMSKSIEKQCLQENFQVFNFHLNDEDVERISALNRNQRVNTFKE